MKKMIALASLALAICAVAPATAQSLTKSQKAIEKEQAKIAEKAQKDADKVAAKAAKETEKINKQAAKDAAKAAQKQAEKAEKAAKKEAEKAAKKAEKAAKKQAEKAAKKAEKAAKKAEKQAEKQAEKAAQKQAKELEKQAKDLEKELDKKTQDLLDKSNTDVQEMKKRINGKQNVPRAIPATLPKTNATSESQKKSPITTQKPSLKTTADSVAYLLGVGQSAGLKNYMQQQLGVDTTYMAEFIEGIQSQLAIDPSDKAQHALQAGRQIGQQIQKMAEDVTKDVLFESKGEKADAKVLSSGIIEGLTGQNAISSADAMTKFNQIAERRRAEKDEMEFGANRRAGEEFLAQNKTKEGVVTLPSGLQYKVLTKGKGALPKTTDKVKVNYEGHLIDGTEFDSSYKRGEPITFAANQVIKGWTEALCLMPVGSKWELYIPQELAYGARKAGNIPPYSTLIFTVELLDIEK